MSWPLVRLIVRVEYQKLFRPASCRICLFLPDVGRPLADALQASKLVQVLGTEANEAQNMPYAQKAFEMLWEDAIAVQSITGKLGREAYIVLRLITIVKGSLPSPCVLI